MLNAVLGVLGGATSVIGGAINRSTQREWLDSLGYQSQLEKEKQRVSNYGKSNMMLLGVIGLVVVLAAVIIIKKK